MASRTDDRYPCLWEGCESDFGRATDLHRHYNSVHVSVRTDCPHKWCGRTGNHGFSRKDHFKEHLREVHKQDIPKVSNRRNSSEKRSADEEDATTVSSGAYKRSEKSSPSRKSTSPKSSRETHRQSPAEASRRRDPIKGMLKVETTNLQALADRGNQYLRPEIESKVHTSTSKRRKQVDYPASYATAYSTASSEATIRASSSSARR